MLRLTDKLPATYYKMTQTYTRGVLPGHRRLLFLLLKFPQNHTIFEEKTNHEGEIEPSVRGARRKDKAGKYGPLCSFGRWPSALRFIFFFSLIRLFVPSC
jgi:hypothetical protein